MNGNTTWAKTRDITINVTDGSKLDKSSLKYQWTTSVSSPSEGSFTTSFNNGQAISSPAGVTGEYYLWVLAKDTRGNTAIERSNAFRLDNTPPVINISGDNPASTIKDATYVDGGTTVTEEHSGINGSVVVTGTVVIGTVGTYYVDYNVSDNAGNEAIQVTRTVNVILPPVYTFDYTGSVQTFTVPITGTYKLEVWGAQGGTVSGTTGVGGKGGYSIGYVNLTTGENIYIYVGGMPSYSASSSTLSGGFNGGGSSYGNRSWTATDGVSWGVSGNYKNAPGGGATDIRRGGNNLNNRIIVAGGGGGGSHNSFVGSYSGTNISAGGGGGGTTGLNGYVVSGSGSGDGVGGTQTAGGSSSGALGIGGNGPNGYGAGGGGGYYGGGYGPGSYSSGYGSSGGGGSGYIGGVTSYGGITAQTIAGNVSMPAPGGGNETGHAGNGYAIITRIP